MKADITLNKKDLNQYGEKWYVEIEGTDKGGDKLKMSFDIQEHEAERMLMLFNFTSCVKTGQFKHNEAHT